MDASKAMAAMVTNEGDIWDYMSGGTGGGKTITEKALPVICITTTAGTAPWRRSYYDFGCLLSALCGLSCM